MSIIHYLPPKVNIQSDPMRSSQPVLPLLADPLEHSPDSHPAVERSFPHTSGRPVIRNEPFRAAVLAELEKVDPHAAKRYAKCHQPGEGWWLACRDHPTEHPREYKPFSCMLRTCPVCAPLLANQVRARYDQAIRVTVALQHYKIDWGWGTRMVTLTSSFELAPDMKWAVPYLLNAARDTYKALWGKKIKTGPRKGKPNGAGAVATLEVGERGHKLHVHMLVWGPYVDQKAISREWRKQTGGAFSVVNVRAFGQGEKGIKKAVVEGLKYVVKAANLSPELLAELHMALKGTRRVRSWGSFYKCALRERDKPSYFCSVCGAPKRYYSEPAFDILLSAPFQLELDASASLKFTEANNFFTGLDPPDELGVVGIQEPAPLLLECL